MKIHIVEVSRGHPGAVEPLRALAYLNFALAAILGAVAGYAYLNGWSTANLALAAGAALIFLMLGAQRMRTHRQLESGEIGPGVGARGKK